MTAVNAYLLFATLMLGLPVLGIWPLVFRDASATVNNPLFITVQPAEHFARDNVQLSYAGTIAQELAEWWFKWVLTLALGLPIPRLDMGGAEPALIPVAVLVIYVAVGMLFRPLEYIGHAAEWIVARREGWDADAYIERQGDYLRRFYSGRFANSDTVAGIKAWAWLAHVLVFALAIPIRREMAK